MQTRRDGSPLSSYLHIKLPFSPTAEDEEEEEEEEEEEATARRNAQRRLLLLLRHPWHSFSLPRGNNTRARAKGENKGKICEMSFGYIKHIK